jgi:hypothetical protein
LGTGTLRVGEPRPTLPQSQLVSDVAKFDGEFASGSQTYAGTGTLRYTW